MGKVPCVERRGDSESGEKAVLDLQVVEVRKIVGDGNLKAFADVQVCEGVVIKGFTVMKGKNGLFVSCPRKASKDGRWFDAVSLEEGVQKRIQEMVMREYNLEP